MAQTTGSCCPPPQRLRCPPSPPCPPLPPATPVRLEWSPLQPSRPPLEWEPPPGPDVDLMLLASDDGVVFGAEQDEALIGIDSGTPPPVAVDLTALIHDDGAVFVTDDSEETVIVYDDETP